MKINKIVALDIRHSHPEHKSYDVDVYYVKFANQLLDEFKRLRLDLDEQTGPILRYSAILLTNYLEDIIADSGVWRSFSALSQQMFGRPVPMFHNETEDYYPDEPSIMAIRFLIWHAATEMDDIWWNADFEGFKRMAQVAYRLMVEAFEQIPVNEGLAADIDTDGSSPKTSPASAPRTDMDFPRQLSDEKPGSRETDTEAHG